MFYKGFRDTIYLTPRVHFCYNSSMKNRKTNKTFTINLTHIATSYPHSIDLDLDTYKTIMKARSTSDAIDIFLINKLGMGWFKNYFFDSIGPNKGAMSDIKI